MSPNAKRKPGRPKKGSEKAKALDELLKRPAGRPFALNPDEETLRQVEGLGRLDCTTLEASQFFRVTEKTWIEFKKRWPEVQEAFEKGRGMGALSLRRLLYKHAERTPKTAEFLAKNRLGMSDKVDIQNTGDYVIHVDGEDAGV